MIQANELRIGNWVEEDVLGKAIIHDISPNHCSLSVKHMDINKVVSDVNYSIVLHEIHPIPLTPEILIACGFEDYLHHVTPHYIMLNPYIILFVEKENLYRLGNFKTCKIKYLHQLQNLYFALTGTELNYQP